MHDILSSTSDKLSQQSIFERWPGEETPLDRSTLSRWLKRATQQGLLCRYGTGLRAASSTGSPAANPSSGPATTLAKQKSKPGATAPQSAIAVCVNRRDRGEMAWLWFNANGVACNAVGVDASTAKPRRIIAACANKRDRRDMAALWIMQ
ncbi:MAG: hypothetical protein FJ271_06660 [Planctomycetes bacterium]|nr:hypothetical protein [Planctomycetota bacterium]